MNDKKQLKVVLIGVLLIAGVMTLALVRPIFRKKSSTEISSISSINQDTSKITVEELAKKITDKVDFQLIDLRDSADFESEHLENSRNFSVNDIMNSPSILDSEKTYIFLDDGTSETAKNLVASLKTNSNPLNVFYLSGGFSAWKIQNQSTISSGNPYSFSDQSKVSYIEIENLKKEIDEHPGNLFIIDLRKKEAFSDGHLPGAQNIFLEDLESRSKEIPLGKKIVLYDKDGLWAFQGAVKLFDLGIFNVSALSHGLDSWRAKGLPVIK